MATLACGAAVPSANDGNVPKISMTHGPVNLTKSSRQMEVTKTMPLDAPSIRKGAQTDDESTILAEPIVQCLNPNIGADSDDCASICQKFEDE